MHDVSFLFFILFQTVEESNVDSLISFGNTPQRPTGKETFQNRTNDLLSFASPLPAQPVSEQQQNKKSSTGSQNSTTFNLFGDVIEATGTNSSTDLSPKVEELERKIRSLEKDLNLLQHEKREVNMKMENLKNELNHKSSEYVKMENELIKVIFFFILFICIFLC